MDIYEKEIECLKIQLTRTNNYLPIFNSKNVNYDPTFSQYFLANQLLNKDEKYEIFFQQLKEEFLRIYSLVSEANLIANEMEEQIIYEVILHIPVSYLKPNERKINNLCEVAIRVKQENSSIQIWNIEKFELKFNNIKKIYNHWKASEQKEKVYIRNNPFFEEQFENLIGIANIHLKAMFYNSKLDYIVPIINTQGEISGKLHVVLDQTESSPSSIRTLKDLKINSTTQSSISEGIDIDIDEQSLSHSQPSLEDEGIDELSHLSNGKNEDLTIKFAIKEVRDLSKTDAERIICRYTFINPKLDQTVISNESSNNENEENSRVFSFDHENEYTFPITDQFLSRCCEGAVSIEVWSQYKSKQQSNNNNNNNNDNEINRLDILTRNISQQWKDVKRHVQLSVEIHELDTMGQWTPVEVDTHEQVICGGVYRLKQGQSKHLVIKLKILPRSDPMPLTFDAIRSVEIGSISTRKFDAPCQLDSYQNEDLENLRCDWLDSIEKQKLYLESQINLLNQQTNKTSKDSQREKILLEQLVRLADQQNIAVFPPSRSGIPGAPAAWEPPLTIERHRPLIFLNKTISNETAGLHAILDEENKTKMLILPLIQYASDEMQAVALWDPSSHESPVMNQVTPQDTLIYLIVKIIILITEPVQMEIVLRKRIGVIINKTEGWWPAKILKNVLGSKTHKRTSVVYEIVSNIPKTLYVIDNPDKTDSDCLSQDSLEKYLQYASTIDSILLLDKLRQEVLLAENSAKQQTIRKSTSVPNIMPQNRYETRFHSPANCRRENINNQISSIDPLIESELNGSTPSMLSRLLFIEEQLKSIQTTTFEIKCPIDLDDNGKQLQSIQIPTHEKKCSIDLDDNKEQHNEHTLQLKYSITPNSIKDYSIGSRVIVNTGHSILDKPGIIRFFGKISVREDEWYGIELEEPIGKNNGSIDGHVYFECPNQHGIFVRRNKIRLVD